MEKNVSTYTQTSYLHLVIKNAGIYAGAVIILFILSRQVLPTLIGNEYVASIKFISLYGLMFLLGIIAWFAYAILTDDRTRKVFIGIGILTGITLCLSPLAKLADPSYSSLLIGYPSFISGLICLMTAMVIRFLKFGEEYTPEYEDMLRHG